MRFSIYGFIFLLFLAIHAKADDGIKFIYQGYYLINEKKTFKSPKNIQQVFELANYGSKFTSCKALFIKKVDEKWTTADGDYKLLKDVNVERFLVCPVLTSSSGPIDAITAELYVDDTCSVMTMCYMNAAGLSYEKNSRFSCNAGYTEKSHYLASASRASGYYACNSKFINKGFWGVDYKNPINNDLAYNALIESGLFNYSKKLITDRKDDLLEKIKKYNRNYCNDCENIKQDISILITRYYPYISAVDLELAALKYIEATGEKKLPENLAKRFPPSSVDSINANGEKYWRDFYYNYKKNLLSPTPYKKDVENFISDMTSKVTDSWINTDFDGLLPKAKEVLKSINEKERQIIELQNKQAEVALANERAQIAASNNSWRKNLKVGDDTFCGPVIEMRPPMVKIAIRVQLQGFANETWLRSDELYPPNYGCRNTNGKLSPLY